MMGEKEGQKPKEDIKSLLNQVGQGLAKIAEMVQSSPMGDEDKSAIEGIMKSYVDFVENKLGSEESEEPEMESESGAVAMEQGMGGIPMSQQYKS